MTSSAPATIPEQIAALNNRIAALEQAQSLVSTTTPPTPDLEDFRQQMEARITNAVNEMQARYEREAAALAVLRAGGQP